MVGLSIVLEGQKSSVSAITSKAIINNNIIVTSSQLMTKTTMIINNNNTPSSSSSSSSFSSYGANFLDQCFLCHQKLSPGKDIYMYKGDRAFCSVECRCKQIFMDEEESKNNHKNNYCSLASVKPSSSSSSSSSSRHRKGTRNRAL